MSARHLSVTASDDTLVTIIHHPPHHVRKPHAASRASPPICCSAYISQINPMALNTNKSLKLYYSIKEVAQMFNVSESLLRYWETEFPMLSPKTTSNKVRQYSEADIKLIRNIHNLVKVRGFKISAARKMINKNPNAIDKGTEILNTLTTVRDELKELRKELDRI